jgi:capsular exopolysaccharide synthesis family protein
MSRIEKSLEKAVKLRNVSTPVVRKDPLPPEIAGSYYGEEEKQVHLRDYLDILIRRKWVVIIFLVTVVISGTLAVFLMQPLYKASTTLQLGSGKTELVEFKDVYKVKNDLETQISILASRNLAEKVRAQIPLEHIPLATESGVMQYLNRLIPISGEKNNKKLTQEKRKKISVGTIMKGLDIVPIKKTKLVAINFISEDPKFASVTANTFAEEYINLMEESKLKPTQKGELRLRKEVDEMSVKLKASEMQLNDYIAKNQFIFMKNDKDYENLLSQKYSTLASKLNDATSERISKEAIYREVNKSGVEYGFVLDNSIIKSLTINYIELESEYFQLLKIHTPESPKMLRLQDQIERLKERIAIEEQKIINTIQSDYKLALEQEKYLSSAIEKLRKDVTDFQQNMNEFQVLKREVETNREIYNSLLQRLKEVDISVALTESDVHVIDRAQVPRSPYKPKKAYNIILSLIFGLFGGVFLAFFVEYFDNSIKTNSDIENISSFPVLGNVPYSKINPKKDVDSILNNNSAFSEAFRSISTGIQFKLPKQILVTSPMAQEGKTIISTSIARSLTSSYQKGIIIDADLRKPDVHNVFNIDNSNGLSSFLAGISEFDGLVKKSPYAGLDIVTAGPIPPNPSELLNSLRMRELIDALSAAYDFIIIDSSPVLGMSDSLILSTIAEAVILVVKANTTPGDALSQTNRSFQNVNAKILGFILNGVETKAKYNYSSYYCSPYLNDNGKEKKLV